MNKKLLRKYPIIKTLFDQASYHSFFTWFAVEFFNPKLKTLRNQLPEFGAHRVAYCIITNLIQKPVGEFKMDIHEPIEKSSYSIAEEIYLICKLNHDFKEVFLKRNDFVFFQDHISLEDQAEIKSFYEQNYVRQPIKT